jgi:hypothetical protein
LAGSGPGGPVPPPPPGSRRTGLGAPPTAKTLLTTAVLSLTAGCLWWAALFGHDPVQLGVSDDGFAFATTAGGNTVLVSRDDDGRFFFVDRAGDLYYDAGPAGFYIVEAATDVIFNGYVDDEGTPHRVVVGKLSDIVTLKPDALAGIPAEKLAALLGSRDRDGKAAGLLTALDTSAVDEADPAAVLLPPNAPVGTGPSGEPLGPPRLEEGMMLLDQKKGVLGGKIKADPADPLDRLAAVADRAAVLKRAYDDAVEAGVVDAVVGKE